MEQNFAGKTAIVTGGSTGIGRATALAFAKRGAKVMVADVAEQEGNETVKMIKDTGGDALFVKCDVSVEADVKRMVEQTVVTFGSVDYAFNNAGIEGERGNVQDCTPENWNRVIDINIKGVWLCMKYQIPQMLKQGKGAIVNCSSVAGIIGFAGSAPYVASKHAVVGLTKTAALENATTGIRVNAVCPGVIDTPMVERVTGNVEEVEQQFIAMEPMGRMGKPEEIADAVLFLCSDAASFMTGHSMPVDGGWLAG